MFILRIWQKSNIFRVTRLQKWDFQKRPKWKELWHFLKTFSFFAIWKHACDLCLSDQDKRTIYSAKSKSLKSLSIRHLKLQSSSIKAWPTSIEFQSPSISHFGAQSIDRSIELKARPTSSRYGTSIATALFRNKRFELNEKLLQNASKFAILLE